MSLWLPTPYVVIEPGKALSVHDMVQVDEPLGQQHGDLMMTTVMMTYANVAKFLQAIFRPHADIYLKKSILQEQTPQEYTEKQRIYMQTSQNNAIQAAYNKAGIAYELNVIDNVQTVAAIDKSQQVYISADEIGGPSAGLMFALDIYNRFVAADITKGYTIAGTGEINAQGQVGPIGGTPYKVVAADRAGAELFFVPRENEQAALLQAERIKSNMQVIAVQTLDEALAYLESLPEK